jgi:hypothetical protein
MIELRNKFSESYSAGCHFNPTFILDATRVSCKEQQRQRQVMCVMILNAMLCGIIAIAIYILDRIHWALIQYTYSIMSGMTLKSTSGPRNKKSVNALLDSNPLHI